MSNLELLTALTLFAIGMYGVLAKRDLLRFLLSVTIILGSITLLALTLSTLPIGASAALGLHALVLITWAVEVVEILAALAFFLSLSARGKADMNALRELRW